MRLRDEKLEARRQEADRAKALAAKEAEAKSWMSSSSRVDTSESTRGGGRSWGDDMESPGEGGAWGQRGGESSAGNSRFGGSSYGESSDRPSPFGDRSGPSDSRGGGGYGDRRGDRSGPSDSRGGGGYGDRRGDGERSFGGDSSGARRDAPPSREAPRRFGNGGGWRDKK